MLLPDVNVVIYAFNSDAPDHPAYLAWLEGVVNGSQAFGLSSLVLSGFIRIVTHPRVLAQPASATKAFAFVEQIKSSPNCVMISPGPRHWAIFSDLCLKVNARGNLVADAYLAAIAIESGCEWITTDRDFSRFPSLKWRHPLE